MREKSKFSDLVRMMLVYLYDGRKDVTKKVFQKNPTLFNESMNKGIIGLLSDWRQKYNGVFSLDEINRRYTMTQIRYLMNEIKQGRIQFLEQLDSRNLVLPKNNACACARIVEKRLDWARVQRYVDSRDKTALMTYLSK